MYNKNKSFLKYTPVNATIINIIILEFWNNKDIINNFDTYCNIESTFKKTL